MNNKIRVLYAEDDPRDADLTQTHFQLEAPDFEIEIVDTGQECLERIGQNGYDVLLLDYHLPDMDGTDVLRTLLRQEFTLPVVMVTGVGDEELVVKALRLGASDYVPKRSNYLTTLPEILRNIADEYRRKKEAGHPLAPSRRRILYAEHSQMDIDLTLQHFAAMAPHITIDVVRSCLGALQLLTQAQDKHEAQPYDLLLTDLHMPGMSALDFCREVKHKGITPPVVIVTGKGDEETAVAALRLGAYDYIVKRDNYLIELPYAVENAIVRFQLDQMNRGLLVELEELNRSLEQKVKDRTAELQREITERQRVEEALQEAHDKLEQRVAERTAELRELVNLMAGREVRMTELKDVIHQLRAQLQAAGLEPVADDPLAPWMED